MCGDRLTPGAVLHRLLDCTLKTAFLHLRGPHLASLPRASQPLCLVEIPMKSPALAIDASTGKAAESSLFCRNRGLVIADIVINIEFQMGCGESKAAAAASPVRCITAGRLCGGQLDLPSLP